MAQTTLGKDKAFLNEIESRLNRNITLYKSMMNIYLVTVYGRDKTDYDPVLGEQRYITYQKHFITASSSKSAREAVVESGLKIYGTPRLLKKGV